MNTRCPRCGALPDGIGGGTGCPTSCLATHPAAACLAALAALEEILRDFTTTTTPDRATRPDNGRNDR